MYILFASFVFPFETWTPQLQHKAGMALRCTVECNIIKRTCVSRWLYKECVKHVFTQSNTPKKSITEQNRLHSKAFPRSEHENIGNYIHILAGLFITRASFSAEEDYFWGHLSLFILASLRSLKTGDSVKHKALTLKLSLPWQQLHCCNEALLGCFTENMNVFITIKLSGVRLVVSSSWLIKL